MPGALDIRPRSRPDPRIPYLRIDVMARRAGPSVNRTRRLSSLVGYPRSAQASDRVRRRFSRDTVSDTDELNLLKYRQAMVKIIAVHASMCLEEIGKDRLSDPVMQAMATVPRHRFVPVELQELAYEDLPLPIGCGKTISQPFIVALRPARDRGTGQDPRDRHRAWLSGGDPHGVGLAGFLGRNHRGAGQGGGTPAARHGLRQRAAADRRWLARLGGACAVRQDHLDRGARAGSTEATRTAEAGRQARASRRGWRTSKSSSWSRKATTIKCGPAS